MVDGAPDQYVIESWVGAPKRCLPETEPFSFTRSVLDFTRKFAPRTKCPRPVAPDAAAGSARRAVVRSFSRRTSGSHEHETDLNRVARL